MRSQNWPRDSGSTPVVGSSRMRRSGVVDEGAAEAQLLLHAAGKLAGGTRLELLHARRGEKLGDLGATLGRRQSEQSAKKVDVLEDGERRIEVAAEALRHIGDAATNLAQGFLVGDALVEDHDLAGLDLLHARDEPEQSRLADAVGSDHADHDAGRDIDADIGESDRRAIPVRYGLDPRDRLNRHLASGVLVSAALLSGIFRFGRGPLRRRAVGGRSGRGFIRRRLWQLDLKVGGPFHVGLGADEPQAANAGLHARVELLENLRIDLQLDAKHELRAFVRGLHRFRGELRVRGDKAHARGNDVVGDWIEDNAGLVADRKPARVRGGQEDRHIDVGEVENRHDRRAGGDDLAGPCKLVLHAAVPRRHEG